MPWTTVRPHDVVAVIMGGGAGTRLFPLTKDRAKPAVPLAGKYRLVDIPISNCLNSELRRIFLLTQFNSGSLHRHIQESYRFDNFSPGFVEILAAEQRPDRTDWYQGTADAVRQNLVHMESYGHRLVLILSGDQLYRMNYCAVIEQHVASGAEVTVATTPVHADAAGGFGIMEVEEDGRITRFVEKPTDPAEQATLHGYPNELPASMGIYVFDREVLADGAGRQRGGLRQAHHPAADRDPASPRLPARGLLGGHRDHPRLLRGQPRPLRAAATSSTSTTPARRSSPTRATCRPRRSSRARSSGPSSPTAASSTTR